MGQPDIENAAAETAEYKLSHIKFEGDPQLKASCQELCTKFIDIFSTSVRKEPARIPPLLIEVDKSKWETPSNQGAPRPISTFKQQLCLEEVSTLKKMKVIVPSTSAQYYSHPCFIPKKDSKIFHLGIST